MESLCVSNGALNQPGAAIHAVPIFMDIILTNWFHQCLPFLRRNTVIGSPTPNKNMQDSYKVPGIYPLGSLRSLVRCIRQKHLHTSLKLHTADLRGHGKTMQYIILLLSDSKFTALQGKIYSTIRMLQCFTVCHHFCENIRKWKQTAVEIDFARCMNTEIHLISYHLVV